MLTANFKVLLDANVLYPFTLRDTLLRAAAEGLYQMYWSVQVLSEATRNLISNGIVTQAQADRLLTAMESHFPESMVAGFEPLIPAMKNEEKDRHVTAAAVKAGAQVIVTFNLKDFSPLPDGIEAQHPEVFLCSLLDLDPPRMVELVQAQAADLRNPPRRYEQVVAALAKVVPEFAEALRTHGHFEG